MSEWVGMLYSILSLLLSLINVCYLLPSLYIAENIASLCRRGSNLQCTLVTMYVCVCVYLWYIVSGCG